MQGVLSGVPVVESRYVPPDKAYLVDGRLLVGKYWRRAFEVASFEAKWRSITERIEARLRGT